MPPSEKRVRAEIIRAAIRQAEKETSLRAVARQVGMSPMGLRNFLNGRTPYTGTYNKLSLWYAEHGAEIGAPGQQVSAILDVLVEGLPPKGQERGRDLLLDVIARLHREHRTQPPTWLAALKRDDQQE
jgi:hypothetical protein